MRGERFAQELFEGLPPRYDLLAKLLSLGQDGAWRKEMVGHAVESAPSLVADVATGPAGVALQLARRSQARVVGVDLTPHMLVRAATNIARAAEGQRVSLVLGSGSSLPFPDHTFQALTFTYLLRYVPEPVATLRELARVVRPGGTVASLEFHVPPEPLWHSLWLLYTRAVLPVAGAVVGGRDWWRVGRFLGPSISDHYRRYSLAWHVEAWRAAGLVDVRYRLMSLGGGIVMWGRKP